MSEDLEDIKFEKLLAAKRHKELSNALKSITTALTQEKEDDGVKQAIDLQTNAIKGFADAIKQMPEPKVNVNVDYENLVTLFKGISKETVDKIEASNNKLTEAFNTRLLPDTFTLVRNYGVTESVRVNYKEANKITTKK